MYLRNKFINNAMNFNEFNEFQFSLKLYSFYWYVLNIVSFYLYLPYKRIYIDLTKEFISNSKSLGTIQV